MILHTAQPADPLRPSLWARVATWFAVAILLCGSVAEAGHLHRLIARPGAAASHTAVAAATPESDSGTNCLLCLLNGSAIAAHAARRMPMLYTGVSVLPAYTSRAVPLSVPFALSNRPPPTA